MKTVGFRMVKAYARAYLPKRSQQCNKQNDQSTNQPNNHNLIGKVWTSIYMGAFTIKRFCF